MGAIAWAKSGVVSNVIKRNLIYHVYPLKNSIWQWNVEKLTKYLHVFNGQMIISIATDEKTDNPDKVMEILGGKCQYNIVSNIPHLGEANTFISAMSCVRSTNPYESTFYAHTKGVKYRENKPMERCAKSWANAMYELNLGVPRAIDRILQSYEAAGCFKLTGNGVPGNEKHNWYFAGTFFWLKHSAIFTKAWHEIAMHYWGVEHYPGKHIESDRAYTIQGISKSMYDFETQPAEYEKTIDWLKRYAETGR